VIVSLENPTRTEDTRLLQVTHWVPAKRSRQGEAVQSALSRLQGAVALPQGLKEIYILTLTLTLMLALLSAVAARVPPVPASLDTPCRACRGTQAVARGDFSRRAPVTSRDELGILTQSFNSRPSSWAKRGASRSSIRRSSNRQGYLESILANLSAGVLVFDHGLVLRIANSGRAASCTRTLRR